MRVAGFTSTGSKRPEALFGSAEEGLPHRMVKSAGCRVYAEDGREYLDFVMALGAVALGYGYPAVTRAVVEAAEQGAVGALAPALEEEVAGLIRGLLPVAEQVRFLKTGAEAAAAAVRLARVSTGRDLVLGCGYHGWLDWCSRERGVPEAVRSLYDQLPFNDPDRGRALLRAWGDRIACVIVEPVVEEPPSAEWLAMLREETHRAGAVLVFDEIKTAFRVALGGAAARWGVSPDLVVLGKAMANGFPLAAVAGQEPIMRAVNDTWISSTLATEFVSLAAGRATLETLAGQQVPRHLAQVGGELFAGLRRLAQSYPGLVEAARGMPELCFLKFRSEEISGRVSAGCARRGLLFKRTAYNFVSLAHTEADVRAGLGILEESLREADRGA